jgi:general secretion pathway protein D
MSRGPLTGSVVCLLASLVAGCGAPGIVSPTLNVQPRLSGQAQDLMPTGAIALPSPSSRAVATVEGGDGRMIGSAAAKSSSVAADGNVVLNLANVPLQQAAKTVLGDLLDNVQNLSHFRDCRLPLN